MVRPRTPSLAKGPFVTKGPILGRPGWMGKGAVKSEILPVVDDPRRGQARLSFESLDRADLATPLPNPGERFPFTDEGFEVKKFLAR